MQLESKRSTNQHNRASLVLWMLLSLISVFFAWNELATSSHFFRQSQTAQTIDAYLREGFDIFYPKLRFFGEPGFIILEFPLFQALVFFICKTFGVSVDFGSRALSLFSAVGFVAVFSRIYFELYSEKLPRKLALLLFSTPLLYAMTTWVTIEIFLLFLWSAAFYFFIRVVRSERAMATKTLLFALLFAVASSFALLIKPNPLLAILPLCAGLLYAANKNHALRARWIYLFSAVACGVVVFLLWVRHVREVEAIFRNPYSLSSNLDWYILRWNSLTLKSLATLASRIALYVFGAGTLALLVLRRLTAKRVRIGLEKNERLVFTSALAGCALYLVTFLNLNSVHNYYQLALLLPTGLVVYRVLSKLNISSELVYFAVAINVALGLATLSRFNKDWTAVVHHVQRELPGDAASVKKKLWVYDPIDQAKPLLAYYLGRYLKGYYFEYNTPKEVAGDDRVFVCPQDALPDCTRKIIETFPACAGRDQTFNKLWVCVLQGGV